MAVRIRLRRVGRKKQPSYRIVVAEASTPRDGAYVDTVGFYNPRRQPAELRMDLDKVDHWLELGAELTNTAASLVRKARKGGDAKVALLTREAAEAPVEVETSAASTTSGEAVPETPAGAEAAAVGPEVAETEAEASAPVDADAKAPAIAAEIGRAHV